MPINELRSITTFVRTAELGSLRKAATAQSITPQAASQALAQLEQHLGVRLFHRTTRNMSLTEEGQRFMEAVQPSLLSLQRALQSVKITKDDMAGPLRIVGPQLIFLSVIGPILNEFCSQYPEIQPDIQLNDQLGNWVEDRVDVGFRIGPSPEEGVIGRRLLTIQLIICAAPDYLKRYGAPKTLEALVSHKCSAFGGVSTGGVVPWYIKVDGEVVAHRIVPAFSSNDEQVELQAVLSGRVIGQLSSVATASHIRAGRLVPLLIQHVFDEVALFLYYGNRNAQPARARAFIELVLQQLSDPSPYVLTESELISAHRQAQPLLKTR